MAVIYSVTYPSVFEKKKNTTSSVNDCTVEDVELLTSPTEC